MRFWERDWGCTWRPSKKAALLAARDPLAAIEPAHKKPLTTSQGRAFDSGLHGCAISAPRGTTAFRHERNLANDDSRGPVVRAVRRRHGRLPVHDVCRDARSLVRAARAGRPPP